MPLITAYRNVFNGGSIVRRKVVKKKKGVDPVVKAPPRSQIDALETVPMTAKPRTLDQKERRSKLAAELLHNL